MNGKMKLAPALVMGFAAIAAVNIGASGQYQQRTPEDHAPLLGVNLIQYEFTPPNCWGRHIILNYHEAAVRTHVVAAPHACALPSRDVPPLPLQLAHDRPLRLALDAQRAVRPHGCGVVRSVVAGRGVGCPVMKQN
jgi:hypothetical protein